MDLNDTNRPSQNRNFFDLFNVGETFPTSVTNRRTGKILEFPVAKQQGNIQKPDSKEEVIQNADLDKKDS